MAGYPDFLALGAGYDPNPKIIVPLVALMGSLFMNEYA
jgi:hypothetical protein